MEYVYPDYYKNFKCIADKCEATCCAQWSIVPDDKSLIKYKNYKGDFAARLQNSIDYTNKEIKRYKSACVFLNEDNLCDLYIEAGEEMLCKTCKRYPRHFEEFENLREVTLSISCPEVARILLNKKDKVIFKSCTKKCTEEEYEDFDYILFNKLLETRELFYKILWERNFSLSTRLSYLLAMSHDFNNHKLYEWDDMISKFENEKFIKRADEKFMNYKHIYANKDKKCLYTEYIEDLSEMEHLKQSWQDVLDKALLSISTTDDFCHEYTNFTEYMSDREYEYEQLITYFLSTYYLGAVYAGRAYDMVRFSVVNLMMIKILGFAKWLQNGKVFTKEDQIGLVFRYSREIEHSDDNLNKFEKNIHNKECYNLHNMLLISTLDN